jgi:hypothetical protein
LTAHSIRIGDRTGIEVASPATSKPERTYDDQDRNPEASDARVYAVTKNGDKSYWTEIGAAWAHQDEKGFNVKLDYLPLNGAEIVIREPRTEGDR